ncbi:GH23164 [Drosophila grimshawi]|uniref:GH23164 n=1 Tax=Drosophila grimshawi TaxID=7222 RepID=B4K1P8_DROGR|nr:GH23164 [Drosophila grimshawi]
MSPCTIEENVPRARAGHCAIGIQSRLCLVGARWLSQSLEQPALKNAKEPREEIAAPAPASKRRSSSLTPPVATPKRMCPGVVGAARGSAAAKVLKNNGAGNLDLRPSTSRAAATKPSSPTPTEPRLSYADMAKKVKVAVLPVSFPRVMLSHGDLSVLEEAIIDEVIASDGDVAVSFVGIHFRVGFLVIKCSDETSADWLRIATSRLQSWKGVPLECKVGDDIPSPHCITLFCPRSAARSTESLLVLLRNQNRIETDTWKVISRRNEGGGALLVIGIDELSKNVIVEKGHQVFFRYGTIPVSGLKKKKTGERPQLAPTGREDVSVGNTTTSDTPAPEQGSPTAQPTDPSEDVADDEELADATLCQAEMLGDDDIPMSSQELEEELQDAAAADVTMTSSGDGDCSRPHSPCQLEPPQK